MFERERRETRLGLASTRWKECSHVIQWLGDFFQEHPFYADFSRDTKAKWDEKQTHQKAEATEAAAGAAEATEDGINSYLDS